MAMEAPTPTSSGEMMPTTGTNRAPPMLASTAATTYARSLMLAGSWPRKRTRSSASRVATRSSPNLLRYSSAIRAIEPSSTPAVM
nr:hypothetical protein [Nocardioides houyundeii]